MSCGVGLKDIGKHILENVDGLNEISLTKEYNLLKPANSRSIDAARHKDALDIRLGTKSCDVSKENHSSHEEFAILQTFASWELCIQTSVSLFLVIARQSYTLEVKLCQGTISYVHSSPVTIDHTMQVMPFLHQGI